jgi:hypothetical protein
VNAIATREKAEGREAAVKAITEQLGYPPEEAKKILDAAKDAENALLSEAQKAAAKAAEDQTKANDDLALARRIARDAALTVALTAHGVVPELDDKGNMTGRAARIVKLLEVGDDADAVAMTAAIEKLKTEEPALFTGAPTPTPPPGGPKPPDGNPPGNPPPAPAPTDAIARGAERAKAVNAQNAEPFDPTKPL